MGNPFPKIAIFDQTVGFWEKLSATASFAAILYVMVFDIAIFSASDTLQVQYTPDDGYYYLMLAKNFAQQAKWTFDSQNVTTGFHPLWATLLAAIHWIGRPTDIQFIHWGLILSMMITLFVLFLMWWENSNKTFNSNALLLGVVLFTSPNLLINSVSLTEWPLFILFSYLCFTRWFRDGRRNRLWLFWICLFGVFTRTDFVLLPATLFVISFAIFYFDHSKNAFFRALSGFSGGVMGLMLNAAANYSSTGSLLQSSALMKSHWAHVQMSNGYAPLGTFGLLSDLLGFNWWPFVIKIVFWATPTVLSLYMAVRTVWRWDKKHLSELGPALGAVATFVSYTLLYLYNADVQPWYTGALLVPAWSGGTLVLQLLWKKIGARVYTIATLIVLYCLVHNVVSIYPLDSQHSPWPHQQLMLKAGKYLRLNELDGPVAAWNAGIIGYYQGGTVVNIDGLVNNGVYNYIIKNDLYGYLHDNQIAYVIDFQSMLDTKYMRQRGGYDDPHFISSLQPLVVFDHGQYRWKFLTLYKFSP